MTSFAKRHSTTTARFTLRTSNPSYISLADLFNTYGEEKVYPFYAVYINRKGNYGPSAVLALNEKQLVNLPQHKLEDCEGFLQSEEDIADINAGRCGFRIYQYTAKNGHTGFSVSWEDVTPAKDLPF